MSYQVVEVPVRRKSDREIVFKLSLIGVSDTVQPAKAIHISMKRRGLDDDHYTNYTEAKPVYFEQPIRYKRREHERGMDEDAMNTWRAELHDSYILKENQRNSFAKRFNR